MNFTRQPCLGLKNYLKIGTKKPQKPALQSGWNGLIEISSVHRISDRQRVYFILMCVPDYSILLEHTAGSSMSGGGGGQSKITHGDLFPTDRSTLCRIDDKSEWPG